MKIYPRKIIKHIISMLLSKYEYLSISNIGELAFEEIETGNLLILTYDYKYLYCNNTL